MPAEVFSRSDIIDGAAHCRIKVYSILQSMGEAWFCKCHYLGMLLNSVIFPSLWCTYSTKLLVLSLVLPVSKLAMSLCLIHSGGCIELPRLGILRLSIHNLHSFRRNSDQREGKRFTCAIDCKTDRQRPIQGLAFPR